MVLLLIDLGGGLRQGCGPREVSPGDMVSVPMKALWKGFTHAGVTWKGSVNFNIGDFMGSMANQAATAEVPGGDSYALLSSDYVNINARFGYHFAILDACASDDAGANHLVIQFAGGISSFEGKSLRVRFLAEVLVRLGMHVDCTGDMLEARANDLGKTEMEELLDLVGRLLASSRLLDMVIKSGDMVDHLVDRFFAGEYDYLGQGATSQIPEFYTHIGNWKLREEDGKKVVATDNTDQNDIFTRAVAGVLNLFGWGERSKRLLGANFHFPLAIARNLQHQSCTFQILIKPVGGSLDRAGGLAFATEDTSNYLVFALSGKENRLTLYAYEDGQCRVLAQADRIVDSGRWHCLRATIEEQKVRCWHDEELCFGYVAEKPLRGWFGLWSRADSVTDFMDCKMETTEGWRQVF